MKNAFIIVLFSALVLIDFINSDEAGLKPTSLPDLDVSTTEDGTFETKKIQDESPVGTTTEKMKTTITKSTKFASTPSTEKSKISKEMKLSESVVTTEKPKILKEMKVLEAPTTTEKLKTAKDEKSIASSATTTTKSETKGVKQPDSSLQTTTQPNSSQTTESTSLATEKNSTIWTDSTSTTSIPDSDCSCDLKRGACDINCCCDPDCSSTDRTVFSSCYLQANYSYDSKYCYTTQFIYRNNTQFKIQKEANSGLFCIFADNFPAQSLYENVQVVKDANQVKKLQRFVSRYSWPDVQTMPTEKFTLGVSYKHGSLLLAISNSSNIFPWSLPKSTVSSFCKHRKQLVYLEDWSSSCKQSVISESMCAENIFNAEEYIKNVQILKSPQLINASDFEGCNSTLCARIKPFICKTDMTCKNITGSISNFYNHTDNSCRNMLHSIIFEVIHNGTAGIKEINAYIHLQNISAVSSQSLSFFQSYKVTFKWFSQTNQTLEKSGFPGYLYRKPLISGFKTPINASNELNKTTIQFHPDSKHWISLIKPDKKLMCKSNERMNILFGTNFQSSCQYIFPEDNLSTTESCLNLNLKLMETLLGTNITNNGVNLFISSFGDPRENKIKDWVPIVLSEQLRENCFDIVTGIKFKIFYAFVGSVLNPQAKIIQVSVSFQRQSLNSQTQTLFCHFKICSLTLTNSVFFTDVTKSAFFKFAEIPVYEIKLPQDFFYPFLSSANFIHSNMYLYLFSTLIFTYQRL